MKYKLFIVVLLIAQYLLINNNPFSYPYTISLPVSESLPGDVLIATISAPEGTNLSVTAQGLIVGTPTFYGGDTWKVTVTVPDTAIRSNIYTVSLLVDNQVESIAHLRITGYALHLPIIYK